MGFPIRLTSLLACVFFLAAPGLVINQGWMISGKVLLAGKKPFFTVFFRFFPKNTEKNSPYKSNIFREIDPFSSIFHTIIPCSIKVKHNIAPWSLKKVKNSFFPEKNWFGQKIATSNMSKHAQNSKLHV